MMQHDGSTTNLTPTRRQLLQALAGLGVGSAVFQRALAAQADKAPAITAEMIQQAEWVSGLQLAEADRKTLIGALSENQRHYRALRAGTLPNSAPQSLSFNPPPRLRPTTAPSAGAAA